MLSLLAFSLIAGFVQPSMASDFLYRFYNNGGCNHASLPANTSPPTGTAAAAGSLGPCVNAPAVNVWNAIEISQSNLVVVTFCGADCIGPSGLTADANCNLPSFSCTTIGSFFVVPVPAFYYRFHNAGACTFNPLPSSSFPPSNEAAGRGSSLGLCINAPAVNAWNAIEISQSNLVVVTFCGADCIGPSGLTADKSCNLPSFSCTTIGSFFVVPVPDFYYRLHDTGGCPFNPLPASSSPPSNEAAGRGNFDSCIHIPLGSWISLEANLGDLVIFTFCSPGCPTGTGKSLGEQGTCSSLAGAGCVPQSFIAVSRDGPVA